jgi:hypothetical protein
VGDFGAMQLGFEHDGVHECFPGRNRTAGIVPNGIGGGNTPQKIAALRKSM